MPDDDQRASRTAGPANAVDLIDLAHELGLGKYERPPAERLMADEIHHGRAKLRPPLMQVHTVLPPGSRSGLYHNDAVLMSQFIPGYDLPNGWSRLMLPQARRSLKDFVKKRPDLFGRSTPLRVIDTDLTDRLWAIDRRWRSITLRTRPDANEPAAPLELLGVQMDADAEAARGELQRLREALAVERWRVLLVCGTDDAGRSTEAALLATGVTPRATLDLDPPRRGFCVMPNRLRLAAERANATPPHLAAFLNTLALLPVGARIAVHIARRSTATVLTGRRADWEPRREEGQH